MPRAVEGPCEPALAVLADGSVLLVFRLQSGFPLWAAKSESGGQSWTVPEQITPWAVWPQLLMLSTGQLLLSSGRPSICLWVSSDGTGSTWRFHNIAANHNKHYGSTPLAFPGATANVSAHSSAEAQPPPTTSYT